MINTDIKPGSIIYTQRYYNDEFESIRAYMLLSIVDNRAICSSFIHSADESLEQILNFHTVQTDYELSTELCVFPVERCYSTAEEASSSINIFRNSGLNNC